MRRSKDCSAEGICCGAEREPAACRRGWMTSSIAAPLNLDGMNKLTSNDRGAASVPPPPDSPGMQAEPPKPEIQLLPKEEDCRNRATD
jgi:hypothetical protein